jgi:hypothetical protein
MEEEVGTDVGYFNLCWTAWNDVNYLKRQYSFELTIEEIPAFVPN